MGGKLWFDKKQISETNKRTSKLLCTSYTATSFIYWHFIFLFQLTILTKSKQYIWSSLFVEPQILAKCPWQSALWSLIQKTFDSEWNALTHFATLTNYYIPKTLAVFTEKNIHYSQNVTGHLLKLVIKQTARH